jgi:hypothetical protein
VTVTGWLIEECLRRIALSDGKEPPAPAPAKTLSAQIDDLPGRGLHDLAARRAYYARRRGQCRNLALAAERRKGR